MTELEVRNVISYYSMLRTKPPASTTCRSAPTLLPVARRRRDAGALRKKLGVGNKGTTPDGVFSVEEVECIGACSWAPAMQVNYDFHENLTPEKDRSDDPMKT